MMQIVSMCCAVSSIPYYRIAPHCCSSSDKRIPIYYICSKCNNVCTNQLITHKLMEEHNGQGNTAQTYMEIPHNP